MYTSPAFVRRGIGRLILDLCEAAARAEGYDRVELVATMGGEPLYLACGYEPDRGLRGRPGRRPRAAGPDGQADRRGIG
jgi:GNAT superfamily N-acetyltransferase